MAVLVQSIAKNLTRERYIETVTRLGDVVPTVPGFISHGSWVDGDRVHVVEMWESQEAFETWYKGTVEPAMQGMNVTVETTYQSLDTVFLRRS